MSHHEVKHSFKEEIIVPLGAMSDNVLFLQGKPHIHCVTSDGMLCRIAHCQSINMLDPNVNLLVWRLYGMQAYEFMQRWHMQGVPIDSIYWLNIRMEAIRE